MHPRSPERPRHALRRCALARLAWAAFLACLASAPAGAAGLGPTVPTASFDQGLVATEAEDLPDLPLADGPLHPVLDVTTYLGDVGADYATATAVDEQGYLYVAGRSRTIAGVDEQAFASCPAARSTGWVAKLAPDASAYHWVFCLTTSEIQTGRFVPVGIALAGKHPYAVVAVIGNAGPGVPTTPDAAQPEGEGGYVTILDATTGELRYASYFGGAGVEVEAVAGSASRIYVAGSTDSADGLPPPAGVTSPFQPELKGPSDAFVAAFDFDGRLERTTFVGGYGEDEALGLSVGPYGDVWIAGRTNSDRFPVSKDAFDELCGSDGLCDPGAEGPEADGFVVRLDPELSQLRYGSYVGGNRDDSALGIGVGATGDVYVVGWSSSEDLPVQGGGCLAVEGPMEATSGCLPNPPYRATPDDPGATGNPPGFAMRLTDAGRELHYATFLDSGSIPRSPLPVQPDGSLWVHAGSSDDAPGQLRKLDPDGHSMSASVSPFGPGFADVVGYAFREGGELFAVGWANEEPGLVPAGEGLQPDFGGGWTDGFLVGVIECGYGTDAGLLSFAQPGASKAVRVATTAPDCPWRAETDADWIDLVSTEQRGDGSFSFSVTENRGTARRTATLRVADREIQVTQAGVEKAGTVRPPLAGSFDAAR